MKVGIITLSLENNYGGILQNFALQKVLKDLGHKPMTCRWTGYTNLGFLKAALLSIIKGGRNFPITPWTYNKSRQGLENFIKHNINFHYFRDPNRFLHWYKPAAMIVGSDQVWRPIYNSHLYSAYLDFVTDKSIKKIAYAASFGVGEWEYSEEQTTQCKDLVHKFDAVSVREASGVILCKENFDIDAKCVLDPTLLLDRKVYEDLCFSEPVQPECILVYMVDYSASIKAEAEKLSKLTGLPIKIMEADKGVTENDSVAKWLAAFRDAKYVITDSFHGTAFSIIFEKNFVSVANIRRGYDRFASLLSNLNLLNRLILESSLIVIANMFQDKIDYALVNMAKRIKVDECKAYLSSALKF